MKPSFQPTPRPEPASPADPPVRRDALDPVDVQRLEDAVSFAQDSAGHSPAALFPSSLSSSEQALLAAQCTFTHCAVLLFPTTEDAAMEYFRARGWRPAGLIASVLVNRRLARRHGLDEATCTVSVTRLHVTEAPGPMVEVFLFPHDSSCHESACHDSVGARDDIRDSERRNGFESHLGFQVRDAQPARVAALADILEGPGRTLFEGGAHNPYEGGTGTTMFYFAPDEHSAKKQRPFPRWELQCSGDLSDLTAARPVDTWALDRSYTVLAGGTPTS